MEVIPGQWPVVGTFIKNVSLGLEKMSQLHVQFKK